MSADPPAEHRCRRHPQRDPDRSDDQGRHGRLCASAVFDAWT